MTQPEEAVRRYRVERYRDGPPEAFEDRVTVEEPLEIRVGGETLGVTMRTPGNDFALAAGWLLSEGIVRRAEEIVRIEHCREVRSPEEEGNVVIVRTTALSHRALDRARRLSLTSSSCGLCGKGSIEAVRGGFPPVEPITPLDSDVVRSLPRRLRRAQTEFGLTGGLHAAGIFEAGGEPRVVREDVGRHNAVDKAVGTLMLEGRLPLAGLILMVSGRASFEIVQKAVAAGLGMVAAVSAPSSLAIDLARESNLVLVGFLRESGFNLYTGSDRVASAATAR